MSKKKKTTICSISKEDLDKAINILNVIRGEAIGSEEYGFSDDWETFMKKMRILTTQSSGSRIQNYIFRAFGWEKIPSTLNRGDVKNSLGQYFEVKATTITTSNPSVNIIQIRLWQNVSGYHIFVIDATDDYKLTHFQLSKSEMKEECELCASHSHGTKEINEANKHTEWSIHFKWQKGDKVYDRWMKKYKQDSEIVKEKFNED